MPKKAIILIIDDEPALRKGLTAAINRHGYSAISAADGKEGLELTKEYLPDLILCDVMMPPPDGFELRRLLSLDPSTAPIPFIFLTARGSVEDRIGGIRDGADDYITKPFVTEELLARIDAVLRRVETEQARGREQAKATVEKDLERVRQEITQNFHHELRTPITNIILPLELAVNQRFATPEEQSRFLRMALSNADRLESLMTDMLMLNNIDQNNLNHIRQPIDVQSQLLGSIHKRMNRYENKALEVVEDCPPKAVIKAPRLEFVHSIVHLMDNACKFTREKSKILLKITVTSKGGATIVVQDDGSGIPVELRRKVFDRYFQASQGDSRQYEGLGVGLTIARAVFRSLGGEVEILDSPKGCRIQASLPDPGLEEITYDQ